MQRRTHKSITCLLILFFLVTDSFAQQSAITTVAGNGTAGFAGDGGPAASARLNTPSDVAVDAFGNIYIADRDNNRVRKVAADSRNITTIAEGLNRPSGLALDGAGHLYIADFGNNRIRKLALVQGTVATVPVFQFYPKEQLPGANDPFWNNLERLLGIRFYKDGFALPVTLSGPAGVAVDAAGNMYVAEKTGHRIKKVAGDTDLVTVIGGTGTAGFSGDGGLATSARINEPTDVAVDNAGNVYFSDSANNRVRRIDAQTGIITTVASGLNRPGGIALDSARNIWVADTLAEVVRRVNASGSMSTIAGGGNTGDGCAASTSSLEKPLGVASNAAGTVVHVADSGSHRVRMITLNAATTEPGLASITPESATSGTTVSVTLTGHGFNSPCRPLSLSVAGSGVTVTGLTVSGNSTITASFVIAADAAGGLREVTVTTDGGTSAPVGFTIGRPAAPPPTLTSITPPDLTRGSTQTLTLTGTNFDMQGGSTTVKTLDDRISVGDIQVKSPTSMTATFTVTGDATLGEHTVAVVTKEGSSNGSAVRVLPQGPTLVYEMPATLKPTEQTPVKLNLAAPGVEPVTGELTLTFVPNTSTGTDDPSVTFINAQANARTASVTFPVNSVNGQLSIPNGLLQAGTVAGTIRLSMRNVQIEGLEVLPAGGEFEIEVPRLAPIITSVRILNRTSAGFDVEVTGYSTSREITSANFDFAAAKDAHLITLNLQPDVSGSFTTYYQSEISSAAGSAFVYLQPFIIQQGDANAVASVTVKLSNAVGTSEPKTAK